MIQIKRTTVNTSWYGWDEARVRLSCDEIVFSSVMRVICIIHREIISLTKGHKKTNFLIQAEYFSPPLIPLKSFAGPVIDT